jgi:hypothetical protein
MRRRLLAKACLAAFLVVVAALPARAGTNVNKVDGVNFQYTATDTNGVLTVNFTNPFNRVTQINNTLVGPFQAEFAQLTLSPTKLTVADPMIPSGNFSPNLNSTQYGIPALGSAPNVLFDYNISFGQASFNGLTLTGAVSLDPTSATSATLGGTTYDFQNFGNGNFGTFTLSLGTQDSTGTLIFDTLNSGNGTFTGTAQFDQVAVPEPSGVVFASICGAAAVLVRRRKK